MISKPVRWTDHYVNTNETGTGSTMTVLPQKTCGADGKLCDMQWCQVNQGCFLRDYKDDGANTAQSKEIVGSGNNTVVYHSRNTTPAPSCHTGQVKLGKIGRATIWLGRKAAFGSEVHAHEHENFALLINLVDDDMMGTAKVLGNAEARKVLSHDIFVGDVVPVIAVDWPDYGVPQLPKAWWVKLHHDLSRIDGHVGIFCHGGHGRTGTAATILAVMSGLVDHMAECPVKWLRKHYCDEVVESAVQIKYIEEICTTRIDAKPAGAWAMTGVDWSHYSKGSNGVWSKDHKHVTGGKQKPAQPAKSQPGDATLSKNQFKKLYRKFGHGQMPRPLVHDKEYWLDGFEYRYSETTRQFVLALKQLTTATTAPVGGYDMGDTMKWAPAEGLPERYIINYREFTAGKPPLYANLLNLTEVAAGEKPKFGPTFGAAGPGKPRDPGVQEVLTLDKPTGNVVKKLMCAGCGQMRGELCKCV